VLADAKDVPEAKQSRLTSAQTSGVDEVVQQTSKSPGKEKEAVLEEREKVPSMESERISDRVDPRFWV
jgi:hypothetical protein